MTRGGPEAPPDIAAEVRALARTVDRLHQQLLRHEAAIGSRLDDLVEAIASGARDRPDRQGSSSRRRRWLGQARREPSSTAPRPSPGSFEQSPERAYRATVVAFCLQPFQVYVNYVPVTSWHGHRCQEILRFLLTRYPSPVSRDQLIETFWSCADPDAARRSLHQAVYRLRETLREVAGGEELICFERSSYRLHPEAEVWIDASEFERLVVEAGRSIAAGEVEPGIEELARAETLYLEDFMHEFPYDDWCRYRREFLRRTYADVVTCLADHHAAQGNHAATIALCQRLVARDPTHEGAYDRLMRSYLSEGHRHLAAAAFRQCQAVLRRELGLEPSPETSRLFAQIGTRPDPSEVPRGPTAHHDGPASVSGR